MTATYTYSKSDFEFDFFMATIQPSQLSEFEWKLFTAARREIPKTDWRPLGRPSRNEKETTK